MIAGVAVGLIAVVVLVFYLTRPGTGSGPAPPSATNAAQILADITSLPTSELDQIGAGTADASKFKAISDSPLASGGKPETLFIGAEYCPYCAATRWPLIIALSRFGTLTGVTTTTSASSDVYPDTATWTFRHASYTSQYLAFVPVEESDRQGNPLQRPTDAESAVYSKYASGVPFVDFGNKVYLNNSPYLPSDLQGLTWRQIADDLKNPSTSQAKEILGSANMITAAICRSTGDQPASVCSDPVIQQIEASLPTSS